MERNLRINWPLLVQEARKRRKKQGFTQERLAAIAEVSTPTVSRFESGEKNIQLSSVLSILDVLGMVEKPNLEFSDKNESYDSDRMIVQFLGKASSGELICAISREALSDHFGAKGMERRALLTAFKENREDIEEMARQKYTARRFEPDGSILIRTMDVIA